MLEINEGYWLVGLYGISNFVRLFNVKISLFFLQTIVLFQVTNNDYL